LDESVSFEHRCSRREKARQAVSNQIDYRANIDVRETDTISQPQRYQSDYTVNIDVRAFDGAHCLMRHHIDLLKAFDAPNVRAERRPGDVRAHGGSLVRTPMFAPLGRSLAGQQRGGRPATNIDVRAAGRQATENCRAFR
jgi:hypothetical protein